jgi:hypothetical protein
MILLHFTVVKTDKEQFKVKIGTAPDGTPITINTLKVGQGSPLVLVHGFGGGLGSPLSFLFILFPLS